MKNDRKRKSELIEELESVRKKVKKLETLLKKRKHAKEDLAERLSARRIRPTKSFGQADVGLTAGRLGRESVFQIRIEAETISMTQHVY